MAKCGGGEQKRAVGKSWTEHRGKVTVTDGKVLRQAVVERQLALIVKVHGLIFSRVLNAVVLLLRDVIHADKSVAESLKQRAVGMIEVGFLVRARPAVIKIRQDTTAGILESPRPGALFLDIFACVVRNVTPMLYI